MKNIFSILVVFSLLLHQVVQANEQSIIQHAFAQSIWTQANLPSQISSRTELQQLVSKIKSPELKKLSSQDFSKVSNKFEPIKISTKMHQVWINDLVIDFKAHSIAYKNNTYKFDPHNIDYQGIKEFIQSHEKKKTSFFNYIISDAHADFGITAVLTILAILAIDSVVSLSSEEKCKSKHSEFLLSVENLENICLSDLESLKQGSSRDVLETSIFIVSLKSHRQTLHEKHPSAPNCADAIKEEFESWNVFKMKSCVDQESARESCRQIKKLDVCLNSYKEFDASRTENTGRHTIHDDERTSPEESLGTSSER